MANRKSSDQDNTNESKKACGSTSSKSSSSETKTVENCKKKKLRCQEEKCNKKISTVRGLMSICRCQKNFCSLHLPSDKHQCTFDYRALGREEIQAKLPKVDGEKIKKI